MMRVMALGATVLASYKPAPNVSRDSKQPTALHENMKGRPVKNPSCKWQAREGCG
jgi:hypothetical protein